MGVSRKDPSGRASSRPRRSRRQRFNGAVRTLIVTGRLPAFMLSVGLAVFVLGFLTSSDFLVRSVVVEGNQAAFAGSIVDASGALGQSIFRLDTAAVARRVAAHPAVASASVSARFPDTVVVKLTERVPVVVWQVGNRSVEADDHGWVIAEAYDSKLPRVYQAQGDLPTPGSQLSPQLVQAARYVTGKLGADLLSLQYDTATGLTAQLKNSQSVVLGDADRLPLKLSVLDAARQLPDHWSKLDVREPDRPYYQ